MDVKEMVQMRMDGASFQEIADACGTSKQNVHEMVTAYLDKLAGNRGSRARNSKIDRIRYEGIYEHFMDDPFENMTSFAEKVYGRIDGRYGKLRGFLVGDHDSYFTISQIKKICEIVGKPFEETFKERDVEEKGE